MYLLKLITTAITAGILFTVSLAASAQWDLDNSRSTVNFISVKNSRIGEAHSFTSLVGYIGADGKVQLGVDLDSVETMIPIRNERLRELLFDTVRFPAASITSQVQPEMLAAVAEGGVVTTDISVNLSLHDHTVVLDIPVVVIVDGSGTLRVLSSQPVILDAKQFGLVDGVTALREIAGLKSISTAVPVSIYLVFVPAT
ncbi:MAG: polyisoprenoid-binding protein YceI [Halieaceae bacterium]